VTEVHRTLDSRWKFALDPKLSIGSHRANALVVESLRCFKFSAERYSNTSFQGSKGRAARVRSWSAPEWPRNTHVVRGQDSRRAPMVLAPTDGCAPQTLRVCTRVRGLPRPPVIPPYLQCRHFPATRGIRSRHEPAARGSDRWRASDETHAEPFRAPRRHAVRTLRPQQRAAADPQAPARRRRRLFVGAGMRRAPS